MKTVFTQLLVLLNLVVATLAFDAKDRLDDAKNFWQKNKAVAPSLLAVCVGLVVFILCCAMSRLIKIAFIVAVTGAAAYFGYKTFAPK